MICSDSRYKYQEWYFEIIIRNFTSGIYAKYHRQINAIICLYYYPQKVCNFHIQVFQIKLKYHYSKLIKLQKFLM